MSLQARISPGDPRVYNPSRDVAHNFTAVVTELAARLEKGQWADIPKLLEVPDHQAGKACEALIKFIVGSLDDPEASMYAAMQRAGWFEVPPAAQIACMAYLGTIVTGLFFTGVREATLGGSGPLDSVDLLVAAGRRSHLLMAMPRWRRNLWRLRNRLASITRAVRSG